MAVKLTAQSFLSILAQSGLIGPDQLQRLLQEFRQDGIDIDDSRAMADELVARDHITDWQADKLLKGKHKGFFLGKYKLLSLLGKGGMSSVYLAEHVLMRRRVAIKVLPSKRVNDTSYLARFHREAQAVAALDHVNIVRAYDVDHEVDNGSEIHFLVMEYVEGQSLHELVTRQGLMGYVQAAECIRQSAIGLHNAHQTGMVHRDIKPGNLLVDESGVVKILDLGLARFFDDQEEKSLTIAHEEKVLGTADYLAPEQALDSHTVDLRADIYSLGCTCYFLLTGHPPFTEGTLAQRLMCHQNKTPPSIAIDRPDIPADLHAIVNKMMAKSPDERYQTAQDVADAMTEWLVEHGGEEWKQIAASIPGGGSDITSSSIIVSASDLHDPHSTAAGKTTKGGSQPPSSVLPLAGDSDIDPVAKKSADAKSTSPPADEDIPLADDESTMETRAGSARGEETKKDPLKQPKSATSKARGNSSTTPPKSSPQPPSGETTRISRRPTPSPSSPAANKNGSTKPGKPSPRKPQANPQSGAGRKTVPGSAPKSTPKQPRVVTIPNENVVIVEATPVDEEPIDDVEFIDDIDNEEEFDFSSSNVFRSMRTTNKRKPTPKESSNFIADNIAVIAGVFVLVAIVVFGGAMYYVFTGNDTPEVKISLPKINLSGDVTFDLNTNVERAKKPVLTVGSGPKDDFKSVDEAVRFIKTDFQLNNKHTPKTINVAGGVTYANRIVIDNSDRSKLQWPSAEIRFVSVGDKPAILAPQGDEPIIDLRGSIDNLTIEGFELAAGGKATAIRLQDRLSGCRFNKLTVDGFSQTGIDATGVLGLGGDRLSVFFDNVTIRSENSESIGMKFENNPLGSLTDNIRITGCRLIGPMSRGILLSKKLKKIAIRESIFSKQDVAIAFVSDGQNWRTVTITNNTFHQTGSGITFSRLYPNLNDSPSMLANLFVDVSGPEVSVETGIPVTVEKIKDKEESISWNWTTQPDPPASNIEKVDVFVNNGQRGVTDLHFISDDPNHDNFLTPSSESSLPETIDGFTGNKAKPFIGAKPRQ